MEITNYSRIMHPDVYDTLEFMALIDGSIG